ncbi:sulfatase-like hydrolase/transferase [bacterium]|nr:sulfatase-like hydrolase/transferase [bacterium]MDB4368028.1 sulfatase-like hydrolase/transferase [Mariniblastus sp.]
MNTSRPYGLTFVLTLLILVSSVPAAQRPNILWIVAEDMSPTLGCYGDAFAITPHIDQLSDEGVLYLNAFATAPVCSPSRSCLINGLYAPSQGTHHMRSAFPIPKKMSGFPSLLRSAGYFTSNNVKTDYNSGNYQEITRASWDASSDTAHWRDRKKGQPFFCVFNLMTSHQSRTMVWPHEKFLSEVQNKLTESEIHDPAKVCLPPYYPDTPVVRKTVARFYDCVTAMDKQVGALLKQLEDDGLAEDTIVFFYSDHGSGMPRHKRALLDSGMHVPLIVRFPKKFQDLAPGKPGTKTARLVSFDDFGPTALNLANVDVPDYMDGKSYLGSRQDKPREFVYGHRDRVDEVHDLARCVRDNRYLYIRNFMPHLSYNQRTFWPDLGQIRHEFYRLADPVKMTAPQWHFAGPSRPLEELYDRQSDPLNLHNLADSNAHRDVQVKMRDELFRHIRDSRDIGFVPEAMAWEISQGTTLWELARGDGAYHQQRLVEAASQVGQAEERAFLANLKHSDAGVRFWGAVGLTASQSLTPRAVKALTAALSDSAIDVRIKSADALAQHGHEKDSIPVLVTALSDENMAAVQHAARTIELLGEKAKSAVPAMKACDLRMKKIRPPGTSPIVVDPDKDKAMWVLFSTEVFLKRFGETDPDFQPIFNGKDLTGWDGDPKTWHVKDGAISCSGKAGNTWLIWRGGELEDFELRLQFRHLSGNSGVQVRSIEDKKWSVVGYQAEIAAQAKMGLWHHSKAPEKYRFALSNAGEKGHIARDGVKTLTRFAPAEKVRQAFRPGEWNEMVIVGQGPKLIQTVNGVVLSALVDLDAKHATGKGLLAFQDHGKGTVVQFRNIRLKQLPAAGDESQDEPIENGKAESERE